MRYSGDPYWTSCRYPCKCAGCGQEIKKDESIFYFPRDKSVFCEKESCGKKESASFEDAAFDESMITGQW